MGLKMNDTLINIKNKMGLANKSFFIKVAYNEIQTTNFKGEIKIEYYLVTASDTENQFKLWSNVSLINLAFYDFDSDKNLLLLNDNREVSEIIVSGKYYAFMNEDVIEKAMGNETFFIKLPLESAVRVAEFDKAQIDIKWITLEGELRNETIEKINALNDAVIKNEALVAVKDFKGNEKFEDDKFTNVIEIEKVNQNLVNSINANYEPNIWGRWDFFANSVKNTSRKNKYLSTLATFAQTSKSLSTIHDNEEELNKEENKPLLLA